MREFVAGFESQVALDEAEAELDEEKRKGVVKNVVGKFKDLRGGLEGAKESGRCFVWTIMTESRAGIRTSLVALPLIVDFRSGSL